MFNFIHPDAEDQVRAALTAAGGRMSHNDLVQGLTAAGQLTAAQALLGLSQTGVIRASVQAQPEGAAVLYYSLPAAAQPPSNPAVNTPPAPPANTGV